MLHIDSIPDPVEGEKFLMRGIPDFELVAIELRVDTKSMIFLHNEKGFPGRALGQLAASSQLRQLRSESSKPGALLSSYIYLDNPVELGIPVLNK